MPEWVDVPGFEGVLSVSRCGQVMRHGSCVNAPQSGGVRWIKPKVLKQHTGKVGYPVVSFGQDGKRRAVFVHRALALAFIPNPEGKPFVNHKDGNKENNDLRNLEWCTHQENMQHAHKTGLIPPSKIGPGEKSPASKLTNESVARIKGELMRGGSCREIASRYGVRTGTIDHIRAGRTWAHVK